MTKSGTPCLKKVVIGKNYFAEILSNHVIREIASAHVMTKHCRTPQKEYLHRFEISGSRHCNSNDVCLRKSSTDLKPLSEQSHVSSWRCSSHTPPNWSVCFAGSESSRWRQSAWGDRTAVFHNQITSTQPLFLCACARFFLTFISLC